MIGPITQPSITDVRMPTRMIIVTGRSQLERRSGKHIMPRSRRRHKAVSLVAVEAVLLMQHSKRHDTPSHKARARNTANTNEERTLSRGTCVEGRCPPDYHE